MSRLSINVLDGLDLKERKRRERGEGFEGNLGRRILKRERGDRVGKDLGEISAVQHVF